MSNLLKKTGLSGAFINLLRLPLDNFASGSKDERFSDHAPLIMDYDLLAGVA